MEAVSVSNHQMKETVFPRKGVLTAPWWPAAVPNDGTIPTMFSQILCSNTQVNTVSILILVFGTFLSDRLD